MVIVNAPLRADQFRTKAEALGLTFVSKAGMKMKFSAPAGQDADGCKAEKAVQGGPSTEHRLFPGHHGIKGASEGRLKGSADVGFKKEIADPEPVRKYLSYL